MASSAVFMLSGYAIHFGLGRWLGTGIYGPFALVIALISSINLLLTTGFPQSASKYIAEGDFSLRGIMKRSLMMQIVISLIIFGLYYGFAGHLAPLLQRGDLVSEAELAGWIRLSAFAIPLYAIYAIYNEGFLNGLRHFGKQSKTLIASSIAKVLLVFLLVWVGWSTRGAIMGYILAAFLGCLLAWRFLGRQEGSEENIRCVKLLSFGLPATMFAVITQLIMNLDFFAASAMLLNTEVTPYSSWYAAASNIAKIPYLVFGGLALTLLPSISKATHENDQALASGYIERSMRYMLMLLVPTALIISATATQFVELGYGAGFSQAGLPLRVLILGMTALAIFFVLAHVIMGAGKPGFVFGAAAGMLALDVVLNLVLVSRYQLMGAAWATTITGLAGMMGVALYVLARFRTLVPLKSFLRICSASGLVYWVASAISFDTKYLPLVYGGLYCLYGLLLLITREINRLDLVTVRNLVPNGRHLRVAGGEALPVAAPTKGLRCDKDIRI